MSRDAGSRGSRLPSAEEASVFHLMHVGVLTCPAEGSLRDVARVMAERRVHFVVVTDYDASGEGTRPWGVVTDLAVARAFADGTVAATARELADTQIAETTPDETLREAALRMWEQRATHLLVVQRGTGAPVGVLSTLDVAAALAQGRP